MSIDELKFRWHYFWNTLKTWISNGAILCKDPLYWDLWADDERVEWHIGSFWQFIKWIVTQIGMAGGRLIKRKWFDVETDTSLKSRKQWKSNSHET